MAFHSKAWTASSTSSYDGIRAKLTAQFENGAKDGLLERLQKTLPDWNFSDIRIYHSRPFARSFFKNGLAIKLIELP